MLACLVSGENEMVGCSPVSFLRASLSLRHFAACMSFLALCRSWVSFLCRFVTSRLKSLVFRYLSWMTTWKRHEVKSIDVGLNPVRSGSTTTPELLSLVSGALT